MTNMSPYSHFPVRASMRAISHRPGWKIIPHPRYLNSRTFVSAAATAAIHATQNPKPIGMSPFGSSAFDSQTAAMRPVEEERYAAYDPQSFYAAEVGEILDGRYRLVSKMGWGTGSTVWMAENLKTEKEKQRFVALKITNSSPVVAETAKKEFDLTRHMFSTRSKHPGRQYLREMIDSFTIPGVAAEHLCMTFEPLRQPLWLLGRQKFPNGVITPAILKQVMPSILVCLDYLHTECHIIHTDLKADHLMIDFEDHGVLEQYIAHNNLNPAPFINRRGRRVYESRPEFGSVDHPVTYVKITDFGLSVRGDLAKYNHTIQPVEYSAPEVFLECGWSYSADIWNLGLVMWELLAETNLVDGRYDADTPFSHIVRMGQIIRLLGPPPKELARRTSPARRQVIFDKWGRFAHPQVIPDEKLNFSFESQTQMFDNKEEQKLFIHFAKRMLTWLPEERATARELLDDPWLRS